MEQGKPHIALVRLQACAFVGVMADGPKQAAEAVGRLWDAGEDFREELMDAASVEEFRVESARPGDFGYADLIAHIPAKTSEDE